MQIIEEYLAKLGFDADASGLFLTLVREGPLPLLAASRKSGLERTRLYRLVEELTQKGLIEEIPRYKSRTIKAADLSTLQMMVKEQQLKSEILSRTLPAFEKALLTLPAQTSKNNVVFYHGPEGIKQMTWHILRSKDLYRTYSYRFWEEMTGPKFVLKLDEEMIKMKLKVRDLFSDQYFDYKRQWIIDHGDKPEGDWTWWHARYIPEKILKIDQNIDIYNDVVAYYHWQGNETFGVEIINPRVADFHKQMHDIVWKIAKPVPDFDWTKPWK